MSGRRAGGGHAPRETSAVGRVRAADPATQAIVRRIVLTRAQREQWPRQDVADVLAMLDLFPAREDRR